MGISVLNAGAICREHAYRPFTGRVFVVGRQTMFFDPSMALHIARSCGIDVGNIDPSTLALDTDTRSGAGQNYISDAGFFRVLGVEHLESIDVSDYEGASVIHDLTQPLPHELEGIADVIVDGSTIDNVFDPAMALRNLARMLRPGGRLITFNMGSNHHIPYTIASPLWFFDYFVVNRFTRYAVYVVVFTAKGPAVLAVDPAKMVERGQPPWNENVESPHTMGIVAVAERGPDTTWDRAPIQHQYRGDAGHAAYLCVARAAPQMPDLLFSEVRGYPVPRGYRFVPSQEPRAESNLQFALRHPRKWLVARLSRP